MTLLITGATGFIGRHLVRRLHAQHPIWVISRNPERAGRQFGNQVVRCLTLDELPTLDGLDAVINLAGEPIADGRWSETRKQRIRDSRWQLTEALLQRLRASSRPPGVWLNASAIGYYGRQGPQPIDESFQQVHAEFTHEVCRRWEALAGQAADHGLRVCIMRFGVVLGADGGALKKMLPAYRLGLGGPLGDGRQMLSWIALDDLLAAIAFLLEHEECRGIYNCTSPQAVSNETFSASLAWVLGRPHLLRTPALLLRALFGEMADVLLYGQNVVPTRLLEAGFEFRYPDISSALSHCLKPGPGPAAQ